MTPHVARLKAKHAGKNPGHYTRSEGLEVEAKKMGIQTDKAVAPRTGNRCVHDTPRWECGDVDCVHHVDKAVEPRTAILFADVARIR